MSLKVSILGSGSATPTSKRLSTAQALSINETIYLIDCAEGTQMQIRRYKIKLQRIKAIFITHLHGDHVFGLPGLLASLSMIDRKEPLSMYGPPPLKEWLKTYTNFFSSPEYQLDIHTLTSRVAEIIYEDKNVTVSSFPLKHGIPTYGYLFTEKRSARSYACCTDTVYKEDLAELIKDVDLLYHEATYGNERKTRAKETYHCTAEDAAKIALAAGAGKLVIGHFSARYKDVSNLLNEARNIFPNTDAAEDGAVFTI